MVNNFCPSHPVESSPHNSFELRSKSEFMLLDSKLAGKNLPDFEGFEEYLNKEIMFLEQKTQKIENFGWGNDDEEMRREEIRKEEEIEEVWREWERLEGEEKGEEREEEEDEQE